MTEQLVRDAKGKRPAFYDNPANDQMMSMIMVLAGEVSVLYDQIDLIKRGAEAKGLDLKGAMESVVLDQAALEEREAARQQLLGRLFYLMRKEAAEAAANETREDFLKTIEEIAQA